MILEDKKIYSIIVFFLIMCFFFNNRLENMSNQMHTPGNELQWLVNRGNKSDIKKTDIKETYNNFMKLLSTGEIYHFDNISFPLIYPLPEQKPSYSIKCTPESCDAWTPHSYMSVSSLTPLPITWDLPHIEN